MATLAGNTRHWRPGHTAAAFGLAACVAATSFAQAQAPAAAPARSIFSCTDAQGRRLTSDRPIPECMDREQRQLNPDGSLRKLMPPSMTNVERAAQDARERQATIDRNARIDATRRDRNLLQRYPDEASHQKARAAALDDVRQSVESSQKRGKSLSEERKLLQADVAALAGKPMPLKLRQQVGANEAATEAQRTLIDNQQTETVRINALFDADLQRLRQLWAGAAPGGLQEPAAGGGTAAAVAKTTPPAAAGKSPAR